MSTPTPTIASPTRPQDLDGHALASSPRPRRLRLFTPAGQLITTGRRRILRLAHHWPWAHVVTSALGRLDHLPNPV